MNSIKLKIAAGLAAVSVVSLGAAYFLNKSDQKKEKSTKRNSDVSFFDGYTLYFTNDAIEGIVTVKDGEFETNVTAIKEVKGNTGMSTVNLGLMFLKVAADAANIKAAKSSLSRADIFRVIIAGDNDVFSIENTVA